jgi:hypothetical protein
MLYKEKRMKKTWIIIIALTMALSVHSYASSVRVAVKRGQKTVDPSILPLVGISFTTDSIALPIESLLLEDAATHELIKAKLGTLDTTHPNVLTAFQGTHRSLCMVIIHLKPGKYRLKSLEYQGELRTYFTFGLENERHLYFIVKDGCVNYIGSIVIVVDWRSIKWQRGRTNLPVSITVEQTASRDAKWAADVIPGMAGLPSENSAIEAER